jgi:hypothetical protein
MLSDIGIGHMLEWLHFEGTLFAVVKAFLQMLDLGSCLKKFAVLALFTAFIVC